MRPEQELAALIAEKYGGDASAPGFADDKARLAAGEPLAYVIGWQPFLGLRIYLDSRPLIPRPETEWWTELLLTSVPSSETSGSPFTFLDLCAGSGAIGCAALKMLPTAHVFFGEIDPAHEATIKKNILENALDDSRANIRIGDLFEPFADMRFDVIAANPPYIPSARTLDHSVAAYEPERALRAGDDGLTVIRRLLRELPKHLSETGEAWIEIDETQADAVQALAVAAGLSAQIRTDQYGQPRICVAKYTHQ